VLTAINMEASLVARKISEDQKNLRHRAEAISDLAVGAITSVKRIISELRPTLLTDLGLAAAIKWQAEEYQRRMGIRFEIVVLPDEFHVNEELGIAIFRIFQEATTNVIRHSKASRVEVCLEKSDFEIMMKIKDNGIGITKEQLAEKESFGIMGMRERVDVYNGTININGVSGKGTTLVVNFPV
jgi:signal transduction histidine kinase